MEVINGCCYGRQQRAKENKGDYIKLCGQRFWEFISGDLELFAEIIEPLGKKAAEHNLTFERQYEKVVDAFTELFGVDFCDEKGDILWEKLARFSSAETPPKLEMTKRKTKSSVKDARKELVAVGKKATNTESQEILKASKEERKLTD